MARYSVFLLCALVATCVAVVSAETIFNFYAPGSNANPAVPPSSATVVNFMLGPEELPRGPVFHRNTFIALDQPSGGGVFLFKSEPGDIGTRYPLIASTLLIRDAPEFLVRHQAALRNKVKRDGHISVVSAASLTWVHPGLFLVLVETSDGHVHVAYVDHDLFTGNVVTLLDVTAAHGSGVQSMAALGENHVVLAWKDRWEVFIVTEASSFDPLVHVATHVPAGSEPWDEVVLGTQACAMVPGHVTQLTRSSDGEWSFQVYGIPLAPTQAPLTPLFNLPLETAEGVHFTPSLAWVPNEGYFVVLDTSGKAYSLFFSLQELGRGPSAYPITALAALRDDDAQPGCNVHGQEGLFTALYEGNLLANVDPVTMQPVSIPVQVATPNGVSSFVGLVAAPLVHTATAITGVRNADVPSLTLETVSPLDVVMAAMHGGPVSAGRRVAHKRAVIGYVEQYLLGNDESLHLLDTSHALIDTASRGSLPVSVPESRLLHVWGYFIRATVVDDLLVLEVHEPLYDLHLFPISIAAVPSGSTFMAWVYSPCNSEIHMYLQDADGNAYKMTFDPIMDISDPISLLTDAPLPVTIRSATWNALTQSFTLAVTDPSTGKDVFYSNGLHSSTMNPTTLANGEPSVSPFSVINVVPGHEVVATCEGDSVHLEWTFVAVQYESDEMAFLIDYLDVDASLVWSIDDVPQGGSKRLFTAYVTESVHGGGNWGPVLDILQACSDDDNTTVCVLPTDQGFDVIGTQFATNFFRLRVTYKVDEHFTGVVTDAANDILPYLPSGLEVKVLREEQVDAETIEVEYSFSYLVPHFIVSHENGPGVLHLMDEVLSILASNVGACVESTVMTVVAPLDGPLTIDNDCSIHVHTK